MALIPKPNPTRTGTHAAWDYRTDSRTGNLSTEAQRQSQNQADLRAVHAAHHGNGPCMQELGKCSSLNHTGCIQPCIENLGQELIANRAAAFAELPFPSIFCHRLEQRTFASGVGGEDKMTT